MLLIIVVTSGYGNHGPYSNRPGYDLAIQALGGMMSITGSSVSLIPLLDHKNFVNVYIKSA